MVRVVAFPGHDGDERKTAAKGYQADMEDTAEYFDA